MQYFQITKEGEKAPYVANGAELKQVLVGQSLIMDPPGRREDRCLVSEVGREIGIVTDAAYQLMAAIFYDKMAEVKYDLQAKKVRDGKQGVDANVSYDEVMEVLAPSLGFRKKRISSEDVPGEIWTASVQAVRSRIRLFWRDNLRDDNVAQVLKAKQADVVQIRRDVDQRTGWNLLGDGTRQIESTPVAQIAQPKVEVEKPKNGGVSSVLVKYASVNSSSDSDSGGAGQSENSTSRSKMRLSKRWILAGFIGISLCALAFSRVSSVETPTQKPAPTATLNFAETPIPQATKQDMKALPPVLLTPLPPLQTPVAEPTAVSEPEAQMDKCVYVVKSDSESFFQIAYDLKVDPEVLYKANQALMSSENEKHGKDKNFKFVFTGMALTNPECVK